MLSRSQTDAGTRLRRAKSAVSVHSQGRSPKTEPIDPVVAREHATAAAVSAFERAYAIDRANAAAERRPVPSRQKSTASRTSQGSHFPSREPSLRSGPDTAGYKGRSSLEQKHARGSKNAGTPRTSGLPKTSSQPLPPLPPSVPEYTAPPVTPVRQNIRKSRSMYNSWGIGRDTSKHRETASFDGHRSAYQGFDDKDLTMTTDFTTTSSLASPATGAADTAKRAEEVAAARDKYLQDFQQSKLRTRPSFMTPFRKLSGKYAAKSVGVNDDQSAAPAAAVMDMSRTPVVKREEKPRSISTFKSKIKRVFRKTSNGSVGLPVQQVTATSKHFGDPSLQVPSASPASAVAFSGYGDFSRLPSALPGASPELQTQSRVSSGGQNQSDGEVSNTKSRVTSWTNSSAGNSVSTRASKRLSVIPENGVGTSSLRRQASSLLRRAPFKKPLHSHGNADEINNVVDTRGVYAALKMRLHKAGLENDNDAEALDEELAELGKTIHDTLPSQTRQASNTSRLSRVGKTTIRTVTPESATPSNGISNITSSPPPTYSLPVESHFGPSLARTRGDSSRDSPDDEEPALAVPRIRLQRASKLFQPTQEQLEIRKNRADTRWQGPLEETDRVFPKDTQRAMSGTERPQLPSLDVMMSEAAKPMTPEPPLRQADDKDKGAMLRPLWSSHLETPMSPSVYSRDSSGESPMPKDRAISGSTLDDGLRGTAMIITSQPVASYPVGASPPAKKSSQSARSSKDWKAWLSKEVAELGNEHEEKLTISEDFVVRHRREHAQIDSDDTAIGGAGDPVSPSPPPPARPALVERSSSRMNERFPMIQTRRQSDKSMLSERRKSKTPSPRPRLSKNAPSTSTKSSTTKSSLSEQASTNEPTSTSTSTKFLLPAHHPSTKTQSRSASSLAHYTTSAEDPATTSTTTTTTKTKPRNPMTFRGPSLFRPSPSPSPHSANSKSAFDLRGQYKFREYTNPNLRRKPCPGPEMEGETLAMVLQGPYSPLKLTSSEKEREKENVMLRARTPGQGMENESPTARSGGGTPTGGQKMAERFLSARQQQQQQQLGAGGRFGSVSPAFV